MEFAIERGLRERPQKVVIYGPEGVGKTSLAARFPAPLFIDTEDGSGNVDVARLPRPTNWKMLLEEVRWAIAHPEEYGTLVLDTADWAQALAVRDVCEEHRLKGIEDMGYGKGYTFVCERFGELMALLTQAAQARNVVITAHAVITKFEQPDELGAYDRWSLKLQDGRKASVAAMVKEWADALLFADYKTVVIATDKNGQRHKAQGGRTRVLRCNHAAAYDAKNRWGLMDEMPMEWESLEIFIPAFDLAAASEVADAPLPFDEAPAAPTEKAPLQGLCLMWNVTEEELRQAVDRKGLMPASTPPEDYPEDFKAFLRENFGKIAEYIDTDIRKQ